MRREDPSFNLLNPMAEMLQFRLRPACFLRDPGKDWPGRGARLPVPVLRSIRSVAAISFLFLAQALQALAVESSSQSIFIREFKIKGAHQLTRI